MTTTSQEPGRPQRRLTSLRGRLRHPTSLHPMLTVDALLTALLGVVALLSAWAVVAVSAASAGPSEVLSQAAAAQVSTISAVTPTTAAPEQLSEALPAAAGATDSAVATTVPVVLGTVRSSTVISTGLADRLAGRDVRIVGDSLVLSASDELRQRLGNTVTIDAEAGLGLYYASGRIRSVATAADIVVVSLGTNDFNEPMAFIDSLGVAFDDLEAASCVIWVDTQEFEPGLAEINAGIVTQAEERGRFVAGWSALSGPDFPDRHASDGYHLSFVGQVVFADLISATIDSACL